MPFPPSEPTLRRAAELHLRNASGALPVAVQWPRREVGTPGVVVLYSQGLSLPANRVVTSVLRRGAGLVVVCAHSARTADDAMTTAEWVADHGRELGADPGGLVVAGVGSAAPLAVSVALGARDHGWPPIAAQVLVLPKLADAGAALEEAPTNGVAPAIVVRAPGGSGTEPYLDRLRASGVSVDELRLDLSDPDGLGSDLARTLRRVLT
jgi:hypothetical protein